MERGREGLAERFSGVLACAVAGGDAAGADRAEGVQRFAEAVGRGGGQVQSACDRADGAAGQGRCAGERVDDARVRAAEDDGEPIGGVDQEGLVVGDRVGCVRVGIEKERAAGVLEIVGSRNGAGDKQAGGQRRRAGGESDTTLGNAGDRVAGFGGDGDILDGLARVTAEARVQRRRMQADDRTRGQPQNLRQGAGVVVVAVADDDEVGPRQVDPEPFGVLQEQG